MSNDNPVDSRVGVTNFLSFTWTIDGFTTKMKMETGERLVQSDSFSLKTGEEDTEWFLMMYPNGYKEKYKGFVSLGLRTRPKSVHVSVPMNFTLSIINKDGQKTRASNGYFESVGDGHRKVWVGGYKFFSHASLLLLKENLLPDDSLTIFCEIGILAGPSPDSVSRTRKPFEGASDRKVLVKTEMMNRFSSDMLSMTNNKFTDVEVVCEGKKFMCHKTVMASRSTVFDAMFSQDMEENRRNRVDISDLDAGTVEDMITYIYSGEFCVQKDKASDLLIAAEKYDLRDLKQMCEECLSENIDKNNVLDMVVFADMYGASMVRNIALKFIVSNGGEIITQPGWREKLKGYPEILSDMFERSIQTKRGEQ